jgi:hypothetical protein
MEEYKANMELFSSESESWMEFEGVTMKFTVETKEFYLYSVLLVLLGIALGMLLTRVVT